MTLPGVSDEVWAQLDPTMHTTRRARVTLIIWLTLVSIGGFVVLLATASGLVVHRLSVSSEGFQGSTTSCDETLRITNDGWFSEHVSSQRLDPRGTRTTLVHGVRAEIPSGGSRRVVIRLDASTCRRELDPRTEQQVRPAALILQLRRPWGASTATVVLQPPSERDGLQVRW